MMNNKSRNKKIWALMLALVMVLSTLMLAGCGGSGEEGEGDAAAELTGWEYIQDKGELVVGLDDTFAPMVFLLSRSVSRQLLDIVREQVLLISCFAADSPLKYQ